MLSGRTSTAMPKTAPAPTARRHEVVRHDNDQATRASATCRCSLARTGAHSTNVGISATSAARDDHPPTETELVREPRGEWDRGRRHRDVEQAEPAVGVPHEDPEAEEGGVPRRPERGRHPAAGVPAAVHEPLGDAAVPEEVRDRLRVRDPPPRDAQGEADDHDDQQRPPDVGDLPPCLASPEWHDRSHQGCNVVRPQAVPPASSAPFRCRTGARSAAARLRKLRLGGVDGPVGVQARAT